MLSNTNVSVALLVIIAAFLIIGPWLLFWSVGAIAAAAGYSFTVPLTFKTWLAAIVFLGLVKGGTK